MKDYVAATGPLRNCEHLYDRSLDRLPDLGDYPVVELISRAQHDRTVAEYHRDPARELSFLENFIASTDGGHRVLFGFQDVDKAAAYRLTRLLQSQNQIRWTSVKYWNSDDDIVLCELKNFRPDFHFLQELYPPTSGNVFFHVTRQTFDLFEIHWKRRAQASLKAEEDPFRRDLLAFAEGALLTLHVDPQGNFAVVRNPAYLNFDALQDRLSRAGERAGIGVTFAPALVS